MIKLRHHFTTIVLSLSSLCGSAYAISTVNLQQTIKESLPAVVNIKAERPAKRLSRKSKQLDKALPNDMRPKDISIGSGVIISKKNGIILTNDHLIAKSNAIIVTLNDGERLLAHLIGESADYDIAVLKIDMSHVSKNDIKQLEFGNSNKLEVGQPVIAIGSPYGLNQSVTTGIISALNRSPGKLVPYANFIQIDAPINPGNSGGALINAQGQLIGINTAIISPTRSNAGLGFAIPSNLAETVALQLLHGGKVHHGMLGIMSQNLKPNLKEAFHFTGKAGILVTNVVPNTPAAAAKLKSGDIITNINGTPIGNTKVLQDSIRLLEPNTAIQIKVYRNQKYTNIDAKVGDPKKIELKSKLNYLTGLRLQNITEQDPDNRYHQGVLLLSLKDNSAGSVAGLYPGDIILNANHQATPTITTLKQVIQENSGDLLIKINRSNGNLFLVIPRFSAAFKAKKNEA